MKSKTRQRQQDTGVTSWCVAGILLLPIRKPSHISSCIVERASLKVNLKVEPKGGGGLDFGQPLPTGAKQMQLQEKV